MRREEILKLIVDAARRHNIPAEIVYGICKQESLLDPFAARFEKGYTWLYTPAEVKPKNCSLETERTLQKTSIGLMQVMGAVYREYRFKGWLTELFSRPDLQIEYGCRHLAKKLAKFGTERGIVAYNSGSPRVDSVSGMFVNQYYLNNVKKFAAEAKDELACFLA